MEKKKAKLSREIARAIIDDVSSEKEQANLIARPLRLAFIVRDNLLPENLLYLLTYISSIWGGYYSCLISTDGNKISDTDWESLNVYEPDKVVFCANIKDSFSTELFTKIENEITPFSLLVVDDWNSEKDIFNLKMKGESDWLVSSIPLTIPMVYNLDKLKRPIEESKSNVRIPDIHQNHPLVLHVAAQVGLVSEYNKKIYLEGFRAKNIEFVSNQVKEYLSVIAEFENKFSPLDMTQLYIQNTITITGADERPEGLNIVFAGNNFVRDLCLFWNLRLAQSLFKKSVLLFLPFDLFRGSSNLQELCETIKSAPWFQHRINIHSASINMRILKRFIIRFNEMMDSNAEIHLIENAIPVAYFHTKSVEETAEAIIEKKTFSFKPPKPEFSDLIKRGEWGVDIKFSSPYEYLTFNKINHFLCGSPKELYYDFYRGDWIRAAHEKFVYRANTKTNFLRGHLISDEQAYQEIFKDKGYSIRLTDKHSYTEGFLKLLKSPDVLEDPKVVDFLWKLQKQEAYTHDNLCSELKKGDDGGVLIDDFVSKRILIRGMEFRCSACGLLRFYPINTLDEEMQCPGCLNRLQPPSLAPIMFRLNELAARAIQQGSIPVVLTHNFLKKMSINQTLRLFGAEVTKDDFKMDIDYITTHQGGLVLVECKDFKLGVSPKDKKGAIQQLSRLVGFGKQMSASEVILSNLLPYPSSDYTDVALEIQKMRNKNTIPIHLLSLSRNGIVDLNNPEKLLEHPFLFDN